jgi:hypothetical protein
MDDPVQPRAELAHVVTALERRPRRDQRLLDDVLRTRLADDAPRVAQQWPPVALDDRLERPLVAGARERDEPLVRLDAQDRE